MSNQHKGFNYLNNNDINPMSDGNSNDWGTSNPDGSSSFHGEDGSWGYTNSDGSGSYHGADGSWGYKNADGSGSYHDADGSWGYREPDGRISYYGSDGSVIHSESSSNYYDNEDDESIEKITSFASSFGEALGTIVGAGISGAIEATAHAVIEERRIELQREEEKRERRRNWTEKHKKSITAFAVIFILIILSIVGYFEYQQLIPVGYSNKALEGLKYTDVVYALKESGFKYVYSKEISDLTLSRENEENLVTEIRLGLRTSFDEETKYPSNLFITVVYHTIELYAPPFSSKEVKGMNYLDVINEYKKIGFTNIIINAEYDIVTGWLSKDGEVESVVINKNTKYDINDKFRPDAEIIITYHTLKKNQPN